MSETEAAVTEAAPPLSARKRRRHRLEALAASVVGAIVCRLPRGWVLAAGRALGRLWAALDPRHVRIGVDNLRAAFPDWDEARLDRTARGVYMHFAQVVLDLLWLAGHDRDEVLSLVDVVGEEHVAAALAEGKGVLFPSAHFGNWEIHAVAHAWRHPPIGVVARVLDNPALDERLNALRTRSGNLVLYKQRALVRILQLLREGRGVAVLMDQNTLEKDGVFVDFFGRPAATTTVIAALAVRLRCPVVPGRAELRPDGRYRMVYEPALRWTPSGDKQEDVLRLTQALTTRIESWAREYPEQWLWIHRRWKTQPAGEWRSPAIEAGRALGARPGGEPPAGEGGR